MISRTRAAALGAPMLLVAGCALMSVGPVGRPAAIEVANGTSMAVTITVDGQAVANVAPGTLQESLGPLPSQPPWVIEARSPSGRILATLTVPSLTNVSDTFGYASRTDLSCGRLDMWTGPPLLGGTAGPGVPGDCS